MKFYTVLRSLIIGPAFLMMGLFLTPSIDAQIPKSFRYQAILRDANGNMIKNKQVALRISILEGTETGTSVYSETHLVTSNEFGLININVGAGTTTGNLGEIQWWKSPYFIRTEVDLAGGSSFKLLGASKILSVPFALYADQSGGTAGQWSQSGAGLYSLSNVGIGEDNPLSRLEVQGASATPTDGALFVVKNNQGDTVFAVFNEGVRVYVYENAKGGKGGFAVGGRKTVKGPVDEIFRVTTDSVRVWVNDPATRKGGRGGFAVGGRTTKSAENFLTLTPDNYYIGHLSGLQNTTGYYNTFFGYHAGQENTTGYQNIFIGNESGILNTEGYANVFIGSYSGASNSLGYWNTFIGRQSGYNNIDGRSNVFIGDFAGYDNTEGLQNVYIGDYAGGKNPSGNENVFIGAEAGTFSEGMKNIYIGTLAGRNAGLDSNNIFIGNSAGYFSETGINNIFLGKESGYFNATGSENIFLGTEAGYNNGAGSNNIFLGNLAGNSNDDGDHNIFLGNQSGLSNTSGNYNILIGYLAGSNITTGSSNNFMGDEAGLYTTTGGNNTFLGDWSGKNNITGSQNTHLGAQAGYNATAGVGNVFLGYAAGFYETGSNRLYVENSVADATTALIYGEFDNNYLRFNAAVGINRASFSDVALAIKPDANDIYAIYSEGGYSYLNGDVGVNHLPYNDVGLTVGTDADDTYAAIYALGKGISTNSWTTTSDVRFKKNIQDLSFSLSELKQIKPVSYDWNREEFPDMNFSDKTDLGLIAQDLEKIIPSLVKTDSRGYKSIDYSKLSVVLLKAMQDQQKIIEQQQKQMDDLLQRVILLEGK